MGPTGNHIHPGHGHHHARNQNRRALTIVLILTASFTVVEAIGGFLTGSLALLADAGHMLSDNLSIALALFAAWLARLPPTPERSFGYKRAEILAALANGVALVAISIWIFIEAWRRFSDPPVILGGWMLVIATGGLVVNIAAALILFRAGGESLNLKAAFRHIIADLLGSIGAITAAAIILLTGWRSADPLVSVLIGLLVLGSSWGILRDSVNVLLEAAPSGMDAEKIGQKMAAHDGVVQVHDLHVWTITSGFPALSAHVVVGPNEDCHARRRELARMLKDVYGIQHSTLQVEHATEEPRLIQISSMPHDGSLSRINDK